MRSFLLFVIIIAAAPSAAAQERFVIPIAEDTLLYVENRGATRILIELNGLPFKLSSDPAEVAGSVNAYYIPEQGALTIDISEYMVPGNDANVIEFLSQGPPGSDFEFVLAPVFVEGQTSAAYRLSGLIPLPDSFRLRAGPNPSRGNLRVTYEIPEARITGLGIRLSVFDIRGRRVATLVDDIRFPGSYSVRWDPTTGYGALPAGVYAIRFESDTGVETALVTIVH